MFYSLDPFFRLKNPRLQGFVTSTKIGDILLQGDEIFLLSDVLKLCCDTSAEFPVSSLVSITFSNLTGSACKSKRLLVIRLQRWCK